MFFIEPNYRDIHQRILAFLSTYKPVFTHRVSEHISVIQMPLQDDEAWFMALQFLQGNYSELDKANYQIKIPRNRDNHFIHLFRHYCGEPFTICEPKIDRECIRLFVYDFDLTMTIKHTGQWKPDDFDHNPIETNIKLGVEPVWQQLLQNPLNYIAIATFNDNYEYILEAIVTILKKINQLDALRRIIISVTPGHPFSYPLNKNAQIQQIYDYLKFINKQLVSIHLVDDIEENIKQFMAWELTPTIIQSASWVNATNPSYQIKYTYTIA